MTFALSSKVTQIVQEKGRQSRKPCDKVALAHLFLLAKEHGGKFYALCEEEIAELLP